MKITTTIKEPKQIIAKWKRESKSIGFVPTMGYLHEGHQSLIETASNENDYVIVSIFVNPTQFGPNEDFEAYPRDLEKDTTLCEKAGACLIFHPSASEMYPDGFSSYVNMTGLTDALCGKSRPIHFQGVCTVVSKLFLIVTPDRAYFGEKDAQQLAIIKRMVCDLNFDIEIVGCPIIRELDGLAKSSRNTYLNPQERKAALVLSQAVQLGKNLITNGETSASVILEQMIDLIKQEPLAKIDYVELVYLDTMQPANTIDGQILCALAVFIGKTRLIDNFIHQ